jgi:hypothetical protein
VKTRHFTINANNACPQGPGTASDVDWYANGVRTSWKQIGRAEVALKLIDVATTRRGDRSSDGFTIGRSTLAQVRARHPKAQLLHPQGLLVLGPTMLSITKVTGYDRWVDIGYWFDARGRLVALETDAGGC